jgi:jumonji domain-containing protein 7
MIPIPRLADAVTPGPGDKLYFAEPLVEQMTMTDFLAKISTGTGRMKA